MSININCEIYSLTYKLIIKPVKLFLSYGKTSFYNWRNLNQTIAIN